jgi:DNA-binding GntR family transcriptional regulator
MNPIDTRSLVDRVYGYLLNRIITGSIKYGDTINIKGIARELDVSTMPVREAVKRLEFERMVSIKPRSSCRVRMPSRTMIFEVYELREALETFAVTKSIGRVSREKLEELRGIVEKMRELDRETSVEEREKKAIELDRNFHTEICALAGNDFLNDFYRQLSLHVNMSLIHEKTYHELESQYPESHAEILRCLEQDPAHAIDVLKKHFTNVTDLLRKNGAGSGS